MVVRVRVKYFGELYDFLGTFEDLIIVRKNEATLKDVLEEVRKLRPELRFFEERVPMMWIYVNGKWVRDLNEKIGDGDVVWLSPALYEGG